LVLGAEQKWLPGVIGRYKGVRFIESPSLGGYMYSDELHKELVRKISEEMNLRNEALSA